MTQKRKRGRLLKFIIGENRADHRGVQGGFLLVKLLLLLAAGLGLPVQSPINALPGNGSERYSHVLASNGVVGHGDGELAFH